MHFCRSRRDGNEGIASKFIGSVRAYLFKTRWLRLIHRHFRAAPTACFVKRNSKIELVPMLFDRESRCMNGAALAAVPACPPLQFAALPNGQLSFRSRGDGEAVVFLHGLLGNSKGWASQFEHLSPNYRVTARDAPGFGQSSLVRNSIEAYAEALRRLVAHLSQLRISLVGHSMGGSGMFRREISRAGLASRLVVLARWLWRA
jgi:hypothetical protein